MPRYYVCRHWHEIPDCLRVTHLGSCSYPEANRRFEAIVANAEGLDLFTLINEAGHELKRLMAGERRHVDLETKVSRPCRYRGGVALHATPWPS